MIKLNKDTFFKVKFKLDFLLLEQIELKQYFDLSKNSTGVTNNINTWLVNNFYLIVLSQHGLLVMWNWAYSTYYVGIAASSLSAPGLMLHHIWPI